MAETIDPKEARKPVAANEVFVLDVRDEEDWSDGAERVPGSAHIAAAELESRLDELPEDRKILLVCPDGERSAEVAEQLDAGDREIVVLEGGVKAWKSDKLRTQPSPDPDGPKGEDEEPHEEPEDDEDDEGSDDPEESEDVENSDEPEENR